MTEQAVQDLVGKTAWAILQDGMPWQVHIYGYDRADRADPYRVFVYRKNAPVIPALGRPLTELVRADDCFPTKKEALNAATSRIEKQIDNRTTEYIKQQQADRERLLRITAIKGEPE